MMWILKHINVKKIPKKLLKISTVKKVIQLPQRHKNLEKRNQVSDFYKISHFSKTAILFSDNLPLLGEILHNNVVWLDLSLSTAHSEPHTNILEFCGLNPMPVTVMVWPPPKLPSEDKKGKNKADEKKTYSMYIFNLILTSEIELILKIFISEIIFII